jgi:hypothetical protein
MVFLDGSLHRWREDCGLRLSLFSFLEGAAQCLDSAEP